MGTKKVEVLFNDCLAGLDVELYDDNFTLCITEYEDDTEKSTDKLTAIKPRSTTEVYLGVDEIKSIINSMQYLLDEYDLKENTND